MSLKKLLTIVCASFVLGLSSCSPPAESPQLAHLTNEYAAQTGNANSKPTSLARFFPDSSVAELRPHKPQYQNPSHECNAVLHFLLRSELSPARNRWIQNRSASIFDDCVVGYWSG